MPKSKPLFVLQDMANRRSRLDPVAPPAQSWIINPDYFPKQMSQTYLELQVRQRNTKMPEFIDILRKHSTKAELRQLSDAFRRMANSLWRPPAKVGRKPDSEIEEIYQLRVVEKLPYRECFKQKGITDPSRIASIKAAIRQRRRKDRE